MSMSMRSQNPAERRLALFLLLCIAALLSSGMVDARERWSRLPETPSLPQPAQSGTLALPDARIWYAVFGDERAPPVVLLHGGGGSSDYWGHLIRDLARDFRVIVIDSRGQGRSTSEAAAISYEQMADDTLAVLNALAIERAAVVGWSDGANIGFLLAHRHPARISALIAFAGNATPAGYQPSANPSTMASYVARTKAAYRKLSPRPERYVAITKALTVMWRTQPALTAKQLSKIKARTAILHAERDEIIRLAHSREIAAQIPGARFVLLPAVSHFAMLQDPVLFNKTVREFLTAQ